MHMNVHMLMFTESSGHDRDHRPMGEGRHRPYTQGQMYYWPSRGAFIKGVINSCGDDVPSGDSAKDAD